MSDRAISPAKGAAAFGAALAAMSAAEAQAGVEDLVGLPLTVDGKAFTIVAPTST